jgi:hypothetical protein
MPRMSRHKEQSAFLLRHLSLVDRHYSRPTKVTAHQGPLLAEGLNGIHRPHARVQNVGTLFIPNQ